MTTKRTLDKRYVFLIYVVLTLTIITAYEPLRHNDFVDLDDDRYVTENPHVNGGITRESVIWAFSSSHYYMWHPLTSLSHMLDCELFGLNPVYHHLVSVLFHIASTLLLFWVLKRITGAVWCSAFVAAAFALHPLNVESVAWVAERKNVLAGLLWMATVAAYIRYTEHPNIGRYLLVVLTLCLGLMAKPIVVTLPFVLLLLDYWPLGRFQWGPKSRNEALLQPEPVKTNSRRTPAWHLITEKIPLFIPVAASSVITFIAQQSGNVVVQIAKLPVDVRIANAMVSYLRYIKKIFYPSRLAMYYPYHSPTLWLAIVCLMILVGVSAVVIYMARNRRYPVVGWFWFLGALVPVIGLVQVGSQAMADRYTYLSSIGIFIMLAWGAAELPTKWQYRKIVLGISSGIVLTILLIGTRMQVRHWRNSFTMFEHTLVVTENNRIMHNFFGSFLLENDRFDEALIHFNEALRISPQYHDARKNKGSALLNTGKFDEAIATFDELLHVRPDWPEAHYLLGVTYARKGQYEQAVKPFKAALRLSPDSPEAYNDLALVYLVLGNYDLAIQNYKDALRLKPDYLQAIHNLKIALQRQQEINETVRKQEKTP